MQPGDLTIGMYVILREVCQIGDYNYAKLDRECKEGKYNSKSFTDLLAHGLLNVSETSKDRVYPSNLGRDYLNHFRQRMGINQL
jgi:hypothetical protein